MWKKTRLKRLDEFYSAVDHLIERLQSTDYSDQANQLDSLIHQTGWTTSSELLGELMLSLKNMKGNYPLDIAREIRKCFEFANHRKILGSIDADNKFIEVEQLVEIGHRHTYFHCIC